MAKSSNSTPRSDKFSKQVKATIEQLRLTLLDLTARNPLISMQFANRSNSHVRVVDELPDKVFFKLSNRQTMDFRSLPSFEEDSKDELLPRFLEAYSSALLTDEDYAKAFAKLDGDDEFYDDKVHKVQRELKDRVREQLAMPKRVLRKQESLAQHARNNGIEPSFDLPLPTETAEDDRHEDNIIQTLLVRSDLERRLNGMISKAKTFEQETGISVMRMAFGFLEWQDPARSKDRKYLSPLVLLPVTLKSIKSAEGPIFRLECTGDDPEVNLVLAEKLRQEFGIEIPTFESGSVESYFEQLNSIKEKKLSWIVRRQVVLGVFSSSRMAMYSDLDTSLTDFSINDIVESVIVGSGSAGAGTIAEEYDVDDPEVELEVPILVKKADQSQFSVLVDVARGKTLAVQGPPGTGKSETIVNAIAGAIAAGKKVLFVAEKAAALKVVNARLVEIGLGEFALPLLAGRTSRDEFMKSLRARIALRESKPRNLEENINRFGQARTALAEYIGILSTEWDRTKKTVHAVLGSAIASAPALETIPKAILLDAGLPPAELTDAEISEAESTVKQYSVVHQEMDNRPSLWRGTTCLDATPRKIDYILYRAGEAANAARVKLDAKAKLSEFGISQDMSDSEVEELCEKILEFSKAVDPSIAEKNSAIFMPESTHRLQAFFAECAQASNSWQHLSTIFDDPANLKLIGCLNEIREICEEAKLTNLDLLQLTSRIDEKGSRSGAANQLRAQIERFVTYWPSAAAWDLFDLAGAANLVEQFRDVIPLRSPQLADQQRQLALKKLMNKAESLKERKSLVSDNFHNSILKVRPEIETALAGLRGAGRFSLLSSAYRDAKSFYLKHAKAQSFVVEIAVSQLLMAAEWLQEAEEFTEIAKSSGVFANDFLGIETDFEPYQKLTAFFESVDAKFGKAEHREVRSFLKTAETDYLLSLPMLPRGALRGKAADVAALAGRLTEEVATLSEARSRLTPLLAHFKDAAAVSIGDISKLGIELSELHTLTAELDSFEHAQVLFGSGFHGWRTPAKDWAPLIDASATLNKSGPIGEFIRRAIENCNLKQFTKKLSEATDAILDFRQKLLAASEEASLELAGPLSKLRGAEVTAALETAANDREGLVRSIHLAALRADLADRGLLFTVEAIIEKIETTQDLGWIVAALLHRNAAERVYKYYGGELRHYTGSRIDSLRRQMEEADGKILELSRQLLRSNLISSARPPQGISRGRVSEMTENALLDHLSDMRRISVPVREIIRRSFQAIQELKPIWMMSPLAIAQYVPKEGAGFDLCIIDEASQMPPADAIGALYRCRQAMVVGDSKQLPPTNFFQQFIDDTSTPDDDADPVTEESILEKTAGAFKPSRTLRWHYRSRHSGLIKFSNKIMYQDDLVVFPSADEDREDMGVRLVNTGGLYKSNMNEIEAKAVIEAALRFMRDEPERSLGIVAVNQKQADYIREQLDREVARDSNANRYVEKWSKTSEGLEEFFVKNIENVQGDQRDVIFISTVYGPASFGQKALQRFGPINGEGGKRRLNVLFTRAKLSIRTFTSLSSADITATEHGNAGAWMLKRWLEYSAGMQFDVANDEPGGAFESPFEQHVAELIKDMGYAAVPQVGSAGFWIDIGVRHPDWPHGFILGVECDGATYHSSKSARDRDHYRQAVLEELGWSIHRIWSTDWYQDSDREKKRLKQAIGDRLAELRARGQFRRSIATSKPEVGDTVSAATLAEPEVISIKRNQLVPKYTQESLPLLDEAFDKPAPSPNQDPTSRSNGRTKAFVELGDTVRVRYLDKEGEVFQFRIVSDPSAPEKGLVNKSAPLATAVLGFEQGDSVEILQGSRIRSALVEMVTKRA
jgi:ABC-type branched-subunit amino acid transport system ATPase component